ncbi:MAG: hypothetical protein HC841_05915, partial [Verrucomicrobiae bacterium]|nr:hypothetical protein [Verrucomicrobiae bacterium]
MQNLLTDPANLLPAGVKPLPVEVHNGLIFIWPDVSAEGLRLSKERQPAYSPSLPSLASKMILRDAYYSYDTMLENVRTKDMGPAGNALNAMVAKLREIDISDIDPT